MNVELFFRSLVGSVLVTGVCVCSGAEGVFVPRNGGVEGRLGASHTYLNATAGGVLEVVNGEWPKLNRLARAEPQFSLRLPPATAPSDVRQGFDRNPEIVYLEEGRERLGVRVRFKLYDAANGYHGHGMTEVWAYANGEVFVSCAASFEGMAPAYAGGGTVTVRVHKITGSQTCAVPLKDSERPSVTAARVSIDCAETGKTPLSGSGPTNPVTVQSAADGIAFGDTTLPGRYIVVNPGTEQALGLYWRSGRSESANYIFRKEGDAPTYYQWPGFLLQAYGGHGLRQIRAAGDHVWLEWVDDRFDPGPNSEFTASFRLMAGAGEPDVKSRVAAEREPLSLSIEGGIAHARDGRLNGYNDMEGVYEALKTNNPVRITIPSSPQTGFLRVKIVGLSGTAPYGRRSTAKRYCRSFRPKAGSRTIPSRRFVKRRKGPRTRRS